MKNHADPCAFHETLRWSVNTVSHSLCHAILDLVRGEITDITISCPPSSDKSFNSSMTLHPPWPSHTLASFIDAIVTEWAEKSRSWCTRLYLLIWHTQETSFSVNPVMVKTVDAIKAASGCSVYMWPHSLRIRLLCFLVRCNVELVTDLIAFNSALGVCPSCQTWSQYLLMY
jgi:hypothetical protein